MKVLVVGSGGREHALVWSLAEGADPVTPLCAPGNPGIAETAACFPCNPLDISALADAAEASGAAFTLVGPEAPLAAGLVDAFAARGLRAFGPTREAARLESSKVFMKDLCRRYEVPTSPYRIFDDAGEAAAYVRRAGRPLVVKADGLAQGKGVVVAATPADGVAAVETLMVTRRFGDAGARVVIEEVLDGDEVSVFAVCDGHALAPLLPAQDHKRIGDGDTGPNTGGMGAYAPAAGRAVLDRITDEILEPALWAMAQEGCPYRGVLFAGVMLTADGPRVLEFNVRFGDPEAQAILPLLDGGVHALADAALSGGVDRLVPRWRPGCAVCVVLAAAGYPAQPRTGDPISGLREAASLPGVLVFHAGTARRDGRLVTAGGRVLNVVGCGGTVEEARRRAYRAADAITYDGKQFRRDIGARAAAARPARAAAVS